MINRSLSSSNSNKRTVGRYIFAGTLALVIFLVQGIADFENWRFDIPSYEKLSRSEGVAYFDYSKEFKQGLPLGIKTEEKVVFVTCRTSDLFNQDCIPRGDRENIEGRRLLVLWSEQPIFLWRKEKRAFYIEIDGEVFRTYHDMTNKYSSRFSWFHVTVSLILYLAVILLLAYILIGKTYFRAGD